MTIYAIWDKEIDSIAALLALNWDNSAYSISNPIYCCWNYSNYTIAKDDTGCLMIVRQNGLSSISTGTAIIDMTGTITSYQNQAQYKLTGYNTTSPTKTQTPETIDLLNAEKRIGNPNGSVVFAKFQDVYFNTWSENPKYYVLGDLASGISNILIYNAGGTKPALNVDDGTLYDITGIVYRFGNMIELLGQFPQTNGSGDCGFKYSESGGDSGTVTPTPTPTPPEEFVPGFGDFFYQEGELSLFTVIGEYRDYSYVFYPAGSEFFNSGHQYVLKIIIPSDEYLGEIYIESQITNWNPDEALAFHYEDRSRIYIRIFWWI